MQDGAGSLIQHVQQLVVSGTNCTSCGKFGVVLLQNFEVVPLRILSPIKTEGTGKAQEGYSMCFACGHRGLLIPNYETGVMEHKEYSEETEGD